MKAVGYLDGVKNIIVNSITGNNGDQCSKALYLELLLNACLFS